MKPPTISAVIRVYNGERFIGQSLRAVLSQTRPPDEVIVVDDGSTDGTLDELAQFRSEIRVVEQANLGVAGAFNRCFAESQGDYVAACDADDVWESDKLERQLEAIQTHPEIDIAIGGARFFGHKQGPRAPYSGSGILDSRDLARHLYRANFVCHSTTLIRRRLHRQLGPIAEGILCEDYDYWLRALEADAVFFYDPTVLVGYRTHEEQVSNDLLGMHSGEYMVHERHSELIEDPRLVQEVLARDLSNIARVLSDQDRAREARTVFVSALRRRPTLRVLAWVLVLSAPERYRRTLSNRLISTKRTLLPEAST
jgi:glycosyltransferase involved in cell wall biosynthesis